MLGMTMPGSKQRRGARMGMELGDNLALQFLKDSESWLSDFEGRSEELAAHVAREAWALGLESCVVWVTAVQDRVPPGVLVPERTLHPLWGGTTKYHCVCLIGGVAHDPWFSVLLPVVDWATMAFPGQPVDLEVKQ